MKILDCTLRDGGYYNSWDFNSDLVDQYLVAVAHAGVDLVELGLRNYPSNEYQGPHYYTTESFLNRLTLPSGASYGVMVDAKTLLQSNKDVDSAINELFVAADQSKLEFVRIACHFYEIDQSESIAKSLRNLGYKVFVNMMQAGSKVNSEIREKSKKILEWGTVDGLYFADSLGNMKESRVREIVESIATVGWSDIGFHAHNNMGQAFSNVFAAIEAGANFLDVTVAGMGRGAGNAETEVLVAELEAQGISKYSIAPLSEILVKHFLPMKTEYGWGSSIFYYLAARYNIHPTYVQTLLNDPHFSGTDQSAALNRLQLLAGRSSFAASALNDLIFDSNEPSSSDEICQIGSLSLGGRDSVMLLGAGTSVIKLHNVIRQFVSDSGIKVAGLNEGPEPLRDILDIQFFSHNARSLSQTKIFDEINNVCVVPIERFSARELSGVDTSKLCNYSVLQDNGCFSVLEHSCVIPFGLTVGYAIASLIRLGIKKIYMVGFDGYSASDPRQKEMSELIHLIRQSYPNIQLISLTKTSYPLSQGSIHAPFL